MKTQKNQLMFLIAPYRLWKLPKGIGCEFKTSDPDFNLLDCSVINFKHFMIWPCVILIWFSTKTCFLNLLPYGFFSAQAADALNASSKPRTPTLTILCERFLQHSRRYCKYKHAHSCTFI